MTTFVNFVWQGHGMWSVGRVTPTTDRRWLTDVVWLSDN